jgi:hypothetical protein
MRTQLFDSTIYHTDKLKQFRKDERKKDTNKGRITTTSIRMQHRMMICQADSLKPLRIFMNPSKPDFGLCISFVTSIAQVERLICTSSCSIKIFPSVIIPSESDGPNRLFLVCHRMLEARSATYDSLILLHVQIHVRYFILLLNPPCLIGTVPQDRAKKHRALSSWCVTPPRSFANLHLLSYLLLLSPSRHVSQ